ncbi:MAG: hypothetical protein CVT95_07835 [Bacteroidetes bacterium HGW-Bacteroidetes-12]|jgi:hypothetical protein|nr:MAG: hypothetical protein CVT95_07835 [Bacteroidetes bacterium HGW-Bacteroidetes-12]
MKHSKDELKKKLVKTGIDFSDKDIDLILDGKPTTLKENILLDDGRKKDAKILISEDDKGKLKFKYMFKEHELIIPKKIGNKVFTEEETNTLKKGQAVNINYKGENLFLQIDPELNTIVVKKADEIKLDELGSFKLGQYEFSNNELDALKNRERVPSIVLKGDEGYFMASVRFTMDNKGVEYSDYKALSDKEAMLLLEERNNKKEITNVVSSSKDIEYSSSQEKAIENTTNVSTEKPNDSNLMDESNPLETHEKKLLLAIKEKDFAKANTLAKNIPTPSNKLLDNIQNDKNINNEDKIAAYAILNVDKNKMNARITELKDKNSSGIKAEADLEKTQMGKPKEKNKQLLDSAMKNTEKISNTAFGDM